MGLYRSLLAGRRVLVLLDNASDAGQVRPLLPGAPGCMAVVTSRNQLAGLVTTAGAYPMTLDLPSADEARELLEHRLGAARVAAESAAVDEIIAMCARLPLALAIVATRAATQPGLPLASTRGRAARGQGRAGRVHRSRPGQRRAGGVLLVVPAAQPGGRAAVPAARAAPGTRHRHAGRGQPRRAAGRRGAAPAGRARPGAPARTRRRPVRVPRPAARVRHGTGPDVSTPMRSGPPRCTGRSATTCIAPTRLTGCSTRTGTIP